MDLPTIYNFFCNKYPVLKLIKLIITPYSPALEYEGRCEYHTLNNWSNDKNKYRQCSIKVVNIEIVDHGDKVFTLIHEISHALVPHYEKKVKGKYIHVEHSHMFYEKFHELLKVAYDNSIVNKMYDLKKLKLVDKCK